MPTPPPRAVPAVVDVAVVGYGYWGPNIVRNLRALGACAVRAICDPSPAARARAAEHHAAIPVTDDYAAILADPSVHAVAIATPAVTHHELVRAALLSGKHVLVEKPLATSFDAAAELVGLADRLGLVLAVSHTFLHTGAVQAARGLVADGTLGRVLSVTSRRENLGLYRGDADVIWDLAPHDVSILTYVLGRRVARAAAHGAASLVPGSTDVASLVLEMEDGPACFVHVSWLSARKVREMVWIGTRRTLIYDDAEPVEKLRLLDRGADVRTNGDGRTEIGYRDGAPAPVPLDATEALSRLCGNFVDAIAGGAPLVVDGRAGLEVVAVLDALERSLAQGGAFVEVRRV